MRILYCSAAALALVSAAAMAQAQKVETTLQRGTFDAVQAREVVEALATALDENFVFPDKGKAYAAALRAKLASGGYATFASAEDFAQTVTRDLQAVHPDGHLRLHSPRPDAGSPGAAASGFVPPPAIGKAGWIAEGVAYISFNVFPSDEATLATLSDFLVSHSSADTLIIDARTHAGGDLGEMDVMFPYFFAEPQTLVEMDTRVAVEERSAGPLDDSATLVKVAGPEGVVRRAHRVIPASDATPLRTATIYLLTSERTASAAEHLALSLKRTGRATLIG